MRKTNERTMSPNETEMRYEIKYAIPWNEQHGVRAWVRGHGCGFRAAYPARRVNSIYFDSPDFECLQVGLAGMADRCKLRLRWYGATLRPESAVLERKQKHGGVGRKLSRTCQGPFDLPGLRHRTLVHRIARNDLGPLAPTLATYCLPVLFNHYLREYYVTADGRVRLTLDSALTFYNQVHSSAFNGRWAEPQVEVMVVELKAAREDEELVARIANDYAFRATAFSKFATGLLGPCHAC
jgi:SPX domain protein involved in polyphosphate accumulation